MLWGSSQGWMYTLTISTPQALGEHTPGHNPEPHPSPTPLDAPCATRLRSCAWVLASCLRWSSVPSPGPVLTGTQTSRGSAQGTVF